MKTKQTIHYTVVKALSNFTSTDKTRPALVGVDVRNGRAAATDGFILATAQVNTNGFTGQLDAKQILATAKGVKKPVTVHLVTDEGKEPRTVVYGQGNREATFGPLTIGTEQYPDINQIMPNVTDEHRTIYLNPANLQKIIDAANAIGAMFVQFDIAPQPHGKGIRFALYEHSEQETPTIAGVVMPMVKGTSTP